MNKIKILLLSNFVALSMLLANAQNELTLNLNWEKFLSRHDLVWDTLPKQWYQAPFLGNGMLGAMVMQSNKNTIRWEIGRGDVQDHRPARKKFGYDTCRLPVGNFELITVGKIKGGVFL